MFILYLDDSKSKLTLFMCNLTALLRTINLLICYPFTLQIIIHHNKQQQIIGNYLVPNHCHHHCAPTTVYFQTSCRSVLAPALPAGHHDRKKAGWSAKGPPYRWRRWRSWKVRRRRRHDQTIQTERMTSWANSADSWYWGWFKDKPASSLWNLLRKLMHWPGHQPTTLIGMKESANGNTAKLSDSAHVCCCGNRRGSRVG